MKTRTFLATLLCLSCVSSVSSAQDIRLDIRVGAQVVPDQSADFVTNENAIPSQTLRLSSQLVPDTRFILEYGSESPQRVTRHLDIEATFLRQRFMVGAEWGPTFFGFLRPVVGVTAGYSLGALDFDTSQIQYSDYSHDIMADAYIGSEATYDLTDRWFVTGGLRFGARLQTAAEFDELTTDRPDADPWQREDPALGTINPNGWYVDFGVGIGMNF